MEGRNYPATPDSALELRLRVLGARGGFASPKRSDQEHYLVYEGEKPRIRELSWLDVTKTLNIVEANFTPQRAA